MIPADLPEPDFWTCKEDAEQLDCSDEDEAIEEYLDFSLHPNMTAAQAMAALPKTVEVYGYTRDEGPDEKEKNSWALGLTEQLLEWIDDEYGDPDGETDNENEPEVKNIAREMVDKALENYTIWRCHKVCTKTVDVEEWVKKERPDWLEDDCLRCKGDGTIDNEGPTHPCPDCFGTGRYGTERKQQ